MLTPVELRERIREVRGEVEDLEGGDNVLALIGHIEDDCGLHSICSFCREFSGEWSDLLRHMETCQAIKRNRDHDKAKYGVDSRRSFC